MSKVAAAAPLSKSSYALATPSEVNFDSASSVLFALVASVCVLNFLEVSVATTNASYSLHISGVTRFVGTIVMSVVMLVAEIIVVGTMVPGSEIVGPATISVVPLVDIAEGVVTWSIAKGMSTEANNVAYIPRSVLMALIADASTLLAVVSIVVTVDGVESDINFT